MSGNLSNPSRYLDYLPAVLQNDQMVNQFLLAFEQILTGRSKGTSAQQIGRILPTDRDPPGLEAVMQQIHTYFDPALTPPEFLPWLAGWVAVSLHNDWDIAMQRAFIQQIVPLYKLRGTPEGLKRILGIYLKNAGFSTEVKIFDQIDRYPNYFQVELLLHHADPVQYWRKARIAKAIIDQEKPAHTFYALRILVPTLRITASPRLNQLNCFFTLFALDTHSSSSESPARSRDLKIETTIVFTSFPGSADQLSQLVSVLIKGKSSRIEVDIEMKRIDETHTLRGVKYLTYQEMGNDPDGFELEIVNQTGKTITGTATAKLFFQVNQNFGSSATAAQRSIKTNPDLPALTLWQQAGEQLEGNTLIRRAAAVEFQVLPEEPLHFPGLRIYKPREDRQSGNTVIARADPTQGRPAGMYIPKHKQTRTLPLLKQFTDQQVTVEAIVTLNASQNGVVQSSEQMRQLIQNLMLRPVTAEIERDRQTQFGLQPEDRTSRRWLLASSSTAEGNTIRCSRTLSYQQLLNNVDGCTTFQPSPQKPENTVPGLAVTLTNFNSPELPSDDQDDSELRDENNRQHLAVSGKMSINLYFGDDSSGLTCEIIKEQPFILPFAEPETTLTICSLKDGQLQGETVLGTTTQLL